MEVSEAAPAPPAPPPAASGRLASDEAAEPVKPPLQKEEEQLGGALRLVFSKDGQDSDEDAEDDDLKEIEVSPDGRWKRMRAKYQSSKADDATTATQSNLAYDNDSGRMMVWNQTFLSKKRWHQAVKQGPNGPADLRTKVLQEFQALRKIKHINIVAFLANWTDGSWAEWDPNRLPRIVWIAEQMTAGTLRMHIKKVKGNKVAIKEKIWKRWCKQIVSALRYLHNEGLPHGNIKSSTIHVQHKGGIKIGSPSYKMMDQNVKTMKADQASGDNWIYNWIYDAPEVLMTQVDRDESGTGGEAKRLDERKRWLDTKCKADIYAFGIVALEMITLETPYSEYPSFETLMRAKNDDSALPAALTRLEAQGAHETSAFINRCLAPIKERPDATVLMGDRVLHEVPKLVEFAAHQVVRMVQDMEQRFEDKAKGANVNDTELQFDADGWLSSALLEPYAKWRIQDPDDVPCMYLIRNGNLIPCKFPDDPAQVDIETLLDEVGSGLHEKFSVKENNRPSRPSVVSAEQEKEDAKIVEEGQPPVDCRNALLRVKGQPSIVINASSQDDDDGMKYDISITLNLQESSEQNALDAKAENKTTRRQVRFGYPKRLKPGTDAQNIVEQLQACRLLHADDCSQVTVAVEKAIAGQVEGK